MNRGREEGMRELQDTKGRSHVRSKSHFGKSSDQGQSRGEMTLQEMHL